MKIYYAHPISSYNTPQEDFDVARLERLGFEVLNPGAQEHQGDKPMSYYLDLATSCDAIAFRAFEDGKIGSGVILEIVECRRRNMPIIELPTFSKDRYLNREQTHNRVRGK